MSWSGSNVFRDWRRHYRHEGFAMSRHAPDRGQQLAHRRDHRDLAGFARGPKAFIVLTQPRIAPHAVENHHPERLAQARIPKRNCWTTGEAPLLPRLLQPWRHADIARDCAGAAKARRISEFCDHTGSG